MSLVSLLAAFAIMLLIQTATVSPLDITAAKQQTVQQQEKAQQPPKQPCAVPSKDNKPVCGINGDRVMLFVDECHLDQANRDNPNEPAFKMVAIGFCVKDCVLVCTSVYAPICALNSTNVTKRTFNNHCEMIRDACLTNTTWTYYTSGACATQSTIPDANNALLGTSHKWQKRKAHTKDRRTKPLRCTKVNNPVCASLFGVKSTFINECSVLAENIKTGENWEIFAEGVCAEDSELAPPQSEQNVSTEHTSAQDNSDANSNQVVHLKAPADFSTDILELNSKNMAQLETKTPTLDQTNSYLAVGEAGKQGAPQTLQRAMEFSRSNRPTNAKVELMQRFPTSMLMLPNAEPLLDFTTNKMISSWQQNRNPYVNSEMSLPKSPLSLQSPQYMHARNFRGPMQPQISTNHTNNFLTVMPVQHTRTPAGIVFAQQNVKAVNSSADMKTEAAELVSMVNMLPNSQMARGNRAASEEMQSLHNMLRAGRRFQTMPAMGVTKSEATQTMMRTKSYSTDGDASYSGPESLEPTFDIHSDPNLQSRKPIGPLLNVFNSQLDGPTNPETSHRNPTYYIYRMKPETMQARYSLPSHPTPQQQQIPVNPALQQLPPIPLQPQRQLVLQDHSTYAPKALENSYNLHDHLQRMQPPAPNSHFAPPTTFFPNSRDVFTPRPNPTQTCKFGVDPICGILGSNTRDFNNFCELLQRNALLKENWAFLHEGKCAVNCNSLQCKKDYEPLCVSWNGLKYTIFNECHYKVATCQDHRSDWKIISQGECPIEHKRLFEGEIPTGTPFATSTTTASPSRKPVPTFVEKRDSTTPLPTTTLAAVMKHTNLPTTMANIPSTTTRTTEKITAPTVATSSTSTTTTTTTTTTTQKPKPAASTKASVVYATSRRKSKHPTPKRPSIKSAVTPAIASSAAITKATASIAPEVAVLRSIPTSTPLTTDAIPPISTTERMSIYGPHLSSYIMRLLLAKRKELGIDAKKADTM